MKKLFLILFISSFFVKGFTQKTVHLTDETFKQLVFDYDKEQKWKYKGKKPAIVDFYADWCRPCKMVAPILDDIAKEYGSKLVIYKVNTEQARKVAAAFGITSIPSLLFIPMNEPPQMAQGALPRESFDKAIGEVLKVKK